MDLRLAKVARHPAILASLTVPLALVAVLLPVLGTEWRIPFLETALSHWLSAFIAMGFVPVLGMARGGIEPNDRFRLSRSPLIIGIAGDSGSGKDTLANSLVGVFGPHSVAGISGDDYHRWERHEPMWQAITHLNPRANDLSRFNRDVMALAAGRPINAPKYDHETGRFLTPRLVAPNDVVLVTGLHALYDPVLRERFDLKIFLDMDEGLKRLF